MPQRSGHHKEPPCKSTKFIAQAGVNSGGTRRHSDIKCNIQPAMPDRIIGESKAMQEAHTHTENTGKCCGKNGGNRSQRRDRCGSSHKNEAKAQAATSALEILQQRFARGKIDTAEFEQKRRLIANT
jgi:hypothetical protein